MRAPASQSLRFFLKLFLPALAFVFLANLLIDPFDLFDLMHIPALNGRKINIDQYSPLVKAAGIVRLKPDTIILGSSVADNGFALTGSTGEFYDDAWPENNARTRQAIACCLPVYNAAIRGGGVYEAEQFFRHALKNNPHLKRVVIGLEWSLFTSAKPLAPEEDAPLLGETSYPALFILNHTLSWDALRETGATFYASSFMHGLRQSLREGRRHAVEKLLSPSDAHAPPPVAGPNTRPLLFSRMFLDDMKTRVSLRGPHEAFMAERLDYVRRMAELARANHIELDVYMSPQHASFWAVARQNGLMPQIDAYQKSLAEVTPYWDFSGAIDFSDNLDNYFRGDSLHFLPEAGRVVLSVIFSGVQTPGAVRVTPQNADNVIAGRHSALDAWLKRHPQQ